MRYKQLFLVGILMILVGVGLFVWANHAMQEIANAKGVVHKMSDFFHNYIYVKIFGGVARGELSKHDNTVIGCYYTGLALIILGAFTVILGWIKRIKFKG